MTTRRALFRLCVGAIALVVAGCSVNPIPEGPSNDDILRSTGLTVAAAETELLAGLIALSPDPQKAYGANIIRHGCRTNQSSMSYGPPWELSASSAHGGLDAATVDRVLAGSGELSERGYSADDAVERRRTFSDDRGFEITATAVENDSRTFDLTLTASSPCAAEEETALSDAEADIRTVTRLVFNALDNQDWDTVSELTCGSLHESLYGAGAIDFKAGVRADTQRHGFRTVATIENIRWLDASGREDPTTPTSALAEVGAQYPKPPSGQRDNRQARLHIEYEQETVVRSATAVNSNPLQWKLCTLEPV